MGGEFVQRLTQNENKKQSKHKVVCLKWNFLIGMYKTACWEKSIHWPDYQEWSNGKTPSKSFDGYVINRARISMP